MCGVELENPWTHPVTDVELEETKFIDVIVDSDKPNMLKFTRSQRGAPFLVKSGHVYRCERHNDQRTYWLCTKYKTVKCGGRLICQGNEIVKYTRHNHNIDVSQFNRSTIIEYKDMTSENVDVFLREFKK